MQRTFQDRLQKTKERGFIGRKEELEFFGKILDQEEPDYVILLIHGIGGVGKSWLLNQIEQQARQKGWVTAKVDDDQLSVEEILKKFRDDLVKQEFRLKGFDENYQRFRQLKSEAEKALSQWEERRDKQIAHTAGRITGRSAAVIAKLFSPSRAALEFLGGDEKLEQMTVDAFGYLVKWFKTQEERDFLENPILQLTRSFIEDLNEICEKKRVILLFDTYEELSKYGDVWLCHTFLKQPLSDQVLLAFAGREEFSPRWLEYEPLLKQRALEVFTEDEARAYLSSRGITDPQRVEDMLNVSGRLPVYLAMLAIQPDGSAQELDAPLEPVVERFLRGISTGKVNQREAVLRCAFPRFFDKDLVKWMTGSDDETELFDWLRTLPFVSRKEGGWRYHGIVRTQLLRYKWQESREEYGGLHRKALAYYREHSGGETFPEELYHLMGTDPDQGFRFGLGGLLRARGQDKPTTDVALISNVLMQVEEERSWGSKWSHQWEETLGQIDSDDPGSENVLKQVGEDESLHGLARAGAYLTLGDLLRALNRPEEAEASYRKAIELRPDDAEAYGDLGWLFYRIGDWDQCIQASRQGFAIDPTQTWLQFNLALALLCQGNVDDAKVEYQKGMRQANAESLKGAITDLKEALEKNPNLPGAKEILAELEKL